MQWTRRDVVNNKIRNHYQQYPQIRPLCVLTEEEAVASVRALPVVPPPQQRGHLFSPQYPPVQIARETSPCIYRSAAYFVECDPYASALLEICLNKIFIDHIKGRRHITLNDKDGLYYTLVQHSWALKPGYPHYRDQQDWTTDPSCIAGDQCGIPWSKEEYLCNGPRRHPNARVGDIVIGPCDYIPTRVDCLWLTCTTTILPYYPIELFRCYSRKEVSEIWVLYNPTRDLVVAIDYPLSISCLLLENRVLLYQTLRNQLIAELREPSCFSPYAGVVRMLGCLPKTANELIIVLRTKIRQLTTSVLAPHKLRPVTYEHALEHYRQKAQRTAVYNRIATNHVIAQLLKITDWNIKEVRGIFGYHIHKRGPSTRVCWSRCGVLSHRVDVSLLPICTNHLEVWLRYLWCLNQIQPPSIRMTGPRLQVT